MAKIRFLCLWAIAGLIHLASAATYVVDAYAQVGWNKASIPEYWPSWDVDKLKPVKSSAQRKETVDLKKITFSKEADWKVEEGRISSNVKGSTLSVSSLALVWLLRAKRTVTADMRV